MRHLILTPLAVSLVMIVCAPSLAAQDQTTDGDPILSPPEISFEGEVSVTGSLIPRADLTALSPVTVLEVPQELTYSGTVRIEDLIRTMPQAFAGQNSTIANGAFGTATIDLRYLGTQRTLVLINGRRMPPADAFGDFAADLNVIPAPLIKRVDVLTGGASTVYGSDAVAGVVNFVMDTDFDGVRGGLQYSFYNHDNNNRLAQQINAEAGFDVPTGMVNDGDAVNANIALGGKFAGGKGHAAVYLDYRKIDELTMAARDYLNCAVNADSDGLYCGGSATSPRGTFIAVNADGSDNGVWTLDLREDGGDGHSFRPWAGEVYNYAPTNHIQRPDEKWNAGAFANYEINKHFDVYMEVMYMNDYTDAQIAPSGNFGNYNQINCDNPMLSEQQLNTICGPDTGYGPTDFAEVYILRRNVEGTPRSNALGHTNIRLLGGLRGEIDDDWSYDFYWLKGQNNQYDSYNNDLSVERIGNALDVIENPDTGEWVCRSGSGDGCLPWNIFQEGAVAQEAIDYISTVAVQYGTTATEVVNLTIAGDLESYGVAIPWASEGLQVAGGAEYREESTRNMPDEAYRTGDPAGFGGQSAPVISGQFNVKEAFFELLVPIIQDVGGARDLSLELGYRYSDYSTSGGVSTYKAQASYAPSESWRIRGGYNRAIRAANIWELYFPQSLILYGGEDICAGENPTATVEQCERTGVPAHMYGHVLANPADQYYAFGGGNPLLDPETADTITAGVVWTPQSIRGLSVTLDYYNIDIGEAIGSLGADNTIQLCAQTGDPQFCDRVHRDAQYTLWLTNDGYTEITSDNIGTLVAEGIDLNFNYLLGLGGSGYLAMDLMGSYLLQSRFSNPVVDYDCTGYFGGQCGQPQSVWRHRFRATWESNLRLNLSLSWRYVGAAEVDDASPNPQLANPGQLAIWEASGVATLPAYNWFDLAASYTFRNGIKLTLGVNNILDEEPPLYWGGYAVYDPIGRYVFSSVQFNF